MSPDPTLAFLDRLNDPTKWVIRRGVPVFKPHERFFPEHQLPNGQKIPAQRIKVSEADLADIARETRAMEEAGMFGAITPGHRNFQPGADETQQPPVWGYQRNPRVGTFGPKQEPCLLVDEYLYPEHAEERKQYPYRSADYFPVLKQIFGYALLKIRPALNLGMVADYQGRGPCYQYAFGVEDMTAPMGPNNAAPPATGTGTGASAAAGAADTFSPEEESQYARMCRYMIQKYNLSPDWPSAAAKPAEEPKSPEGEKKEEKPSEPEKKPDVVPMQANQVPVEYAQKLSELTGTLDGLRLELEHERCQAIIYQLEGEGFRLSDAERQKEIAKLAKMPAADRTDRATELRAIYADRKVPQGRLQIATGTEVKKDPSDPHTAPWYHEAAMAAMYQHPGMTYEAAKAKVIEAAAKQ